VTPGQLLFATDRRSPASAGRSRRVLFAFIGTLLLASGARSAFADDHNPIGVTGAFEGVITTGCAYNVLNHNATRQIDDIVVPGSIGKYPLKMTRYYNTRSTSAYGFMGPGWSHEYLWSSGQGKVEYPNGTVWDSTCAWQWGLSGPLGVSDWPTTWNGSSAFRLADGGTVVFNNTGFPTRIIDPYGQTTIITYNNSGLLSRVTEPGGRYLQFNYSQVNGGTVLSEVDAYDGQGHQTDSVVYHYTAKDPGGGNPLVNCLTSVDYSDGTHAYYTYQQDNAPQHPGPPCPCSQKLFPLVSGCDDVRYHGPMRRIAYEYQDQGPHGAILKERYWDGVAGDEGNGPMVSRIDPAAPSPLIQDVNFDTTYHEYRGDGPTRTFNYTPLHLQRSFSEPEPCPTGSPIPQQFPLNYTDFRGQTTYVGYDPNWYVNSVRDPNNHTTSYARGSPPPNGIGEVLTITHPGGSHIDYTYDDHGHYVHSISNERQKMTTYTRNPNTTPCHSNRLPAGWKHTPIKRSVHLQQLRPGTDSSVEKWRLGEFRLRHSRLAYRPVQS
jgi:YD repeat-containing protein